MSVSYPLEPLPLGCLPPSYRQHAFDIVKSDGGPINYVDPPRRDVVGLGSNIIIRFKTDNPGPWFLHWYVLLTTFLHFSLVVNTTCFSHIDWHLEAGLAVVFAEAPADQRSGPKSVIVPAAWNNLCPIYNALPPRSSMSTL